MSEGKDLGATDSPSLSVVERLCELEAQATPAPWSSHQSSDGSYLDADYADGSTRGILAGIHAKEWPDDAALCAEGRNALPAILLILRQLQVLAGIECRFLPGSPSCAEEWPDDVLEWCAPCSAGRLLRLLPATTASAPHSHPKRFTRGRFLNEP